MRRQARVRAGVSSQAGQSLGYPCRNHITYRCSFCVTISRVRGEEAHSVHTCC